MNRILVCVATAILLASFDASACSTCFGDPQDPQTQGMNAAILTLLGVTYGVFLAMFAAGFVIWRRNRALPSSHPESEDQAAQAPEPSRG